VMAMAMAVVAATVTENESDSEVYTLSKLEIVEYSVFSVTSGLLLTYAAFQLFRIHVRAWQLRSQPRRRSFAAKRAFHGILLATMMIKLVDSIFVLRSPCWTRPDVVEPWWCWCVDTSLRRTNALLLFVAYFVTLLFWAEFVYDLKNGTTSNDFFLRYKRPLILGALLLTSLAAAYVLAVFLLRGHKSAQQRVDIASMYLVGACYLIAGIGIVWKGWDVTMYVRRQTQNLHNDTSRLVLKILILVIICSILLLFRAGWAMVLGAFSLLRGHAQWSPWIVLILHIFCEVVPCICMSILMWPLPPAPHHKAHVQYERLPN